MKDGIGTLSYVEFVLFPETMFKSFVVVADQVLEVIQPAGGAQISEPQQQVRRGRMQRAGEGMGEQEGGTTC